MAKENWLPSDTVTFEAGEDLSAKQFYFVYITSDGQLVAVDAESDVHAVGVLLNDPDAVGEAASVMTTPGKIVKVVSDGTDDIAKGAKVGPDAAGKCVVKTNDVYHGIALEASAAADDGTIIGIVYTGTREV